MAEKLKVPEQDVRFMETVYNRNDTTEDTILDLQSDHTHQSMETGIDELKILKALKEKYIHQFKGREQIVIKKRVLTDEPCSAKELAEEFDISASAVYQIEKRVTNSLIKMARNEFQVRDVA